MKFSIGETWIARSVTLNPEAWWHFVLVASRWSRGERLWVGIKVGLDLEDGIEGGAAVFDETGHQRGDDKYYQQAGWRLTRKTKDVSSLFAAQSFLNEPDRKRDKVRAQNWNKMRSALSQQSTSPPSPVYVARPSILSPWDNARAFPPLSPARDVLPDPSGLTAGEYVAQLRAKSDS